MSIRLFKIIHYNNTIDTSSIVPIFRIMVNCVLYGEDQRFFLAASFARKRSSSTKKIYADCLSDIGNSGLARYKRHYQIRERVLFHLRQHLSVTRIEKIKKSVFEFEF